MSLKEMQREEQERQVEKRLRVAEERAQRAEERVQRAEEKAQRAEEKAQRAEEKVHQLEQRAQQAEAKGNKLLMRWDGERREHERLAVQLEERVRDLAFYGWQMSCTYVWIQTAPLRLMGA